jgi:archaemetzincin
LFDLETYFTSPTTDAERIRRQRDAVIIILSARQTLQQQIQGPKSRALNLLVTNQDIFASKMNFVFGLANQDIGVAVMSIFRLSRWIEDLTPSQIQERVLKEGAHETGHLLGLSHCEKAKCLMCFSENLEQVDKKLPLLCRNCLKKIGLGLG